jgi:hypothetical protein
MAKGGCAVRIAVSGTHITGKSSLVEALGECLPHHTIVPEPYDVLAERGYEFEHPPGLDDFVIQLQQSLITLRRRSPNLIFDRCPLDFLGYISSSPGAGRFDLDVWRGPIARAMKSLDLVISLHVDSAHDPAIPIEDASLRLAVDDVLRDIVDGDGFDLCDGIEILILDGPWDRRVDTVMTHIDRLHARGLTSPRP